jgi:hypothetical protein
MGMSEQMSEPTSGADDKPGSEPGRDAERVQDEVLDQPSERVFDDPTAPVWADPTTPLPSGPAAPTPPGATRPESDEPTASPQETPPVAPPLSNPYAAQPPQPQGQQPPPPAPYGQQQPSPQYQAYGQQQPSPYGQQTGPQYPAYGQQSYATGQQSETNGSAIILTVVSGVSILVGNFLAIASLIMGIVALTKNTTDHEGSRRLTKTGWIVFAVVWVIGVLIGVGLVILFATAISNSGSSNGFNN